MLEPIKLVDKLSKKSTEKVIVVLPGIILYIKKNIKDQKSTKNNQQEQKSAKKNQERKQYI